MSNNNINDNNLNNSEYIYQNQGFFKTKLNKKQTTLLTQSLIWFGFGFILVCLLGVLWSFLISKFFTNPINNTIDTGVYIFLSVSLLVGMIVSIILKAKWSFNLLNAKASLVVSVFLTYVIIYSFLFASISCLFIELDLPPYLFLIAFGITGGLTLLCALIASTMSIKMAMSISKIIGILLGILMFGSLIFGLMLFFIWPSIFQWWTILYNIVFAVIMFLFTMMVFYNIYKMSEIMSWQDVSKKQLIYGGIFFGTEILSNFMVLLTLLVQFIVKMFKN